jgi:hypothetical protein
MAMEFVALAWRHDDPHEHQFPGVGKAGAADPLVWTPWQLFDLEIVALDEPEQLI